MWASGSRVEAVDYLRDWATKLSADLGLTQAELSGRVPAPAARTKSSAYAPLLARCYLKIGQWQSEMEEDWAAVSRRQPFGMNLSFIFVAAGYPGHPSLLLPGHAIR